MNFIYSPVIILTIASLIIRTLIALSSANWIILWAAIELNLLRFIPIIIYTRRNQETEGSVKYFLAQALGSALLLISSTSLWITSSPISNLMPLILTIAVLLKIGRVPCHFWYPSVIASISWSSCLILSTWQKLAPLSILTFLLPQKNISFILAMAGINALLGGVIGINQVQIRTIIAYSSIGHLGWILRLLASFKPNASIIYFSIYSIIIIPLLIAINHFNIRTIKDIISISATHFPILLAVITLLVSLGGLPPLSGFIPKFLTIILLIESNKLVVMLLIVGSLINLFFYLNIVITIILSNPRLKTWTPIKNNHIRTLTFIIASISLGLSPFIILYAMTLLNQPQRYWNTLLYFRCLSRNSRCRNKTSNSNWIKTTWSFLRKGSII